jgi:hypothetical protein
VGGKAGRSFSADFHPLRRNSFRGNRFRSAFAIVDQTRPDGLVETHVLPCVASGRNYVSSPTARPRSAPARIASHCPWLRRRVLPSRSCVSCVVIGGFSLLGDSLETKKAHAASSTWASIVVIPSVLLQGRKPSVNRSRRHSHSLSDLFVCSPLQI